MGWVFIHILKNFAFTQIWIDFLNFSADSLNAKILEIKNF